MLPMVPTCVLQFVDEQYLGILIAKVDEIAQNSRFDIDPNCLAMFHGIVDMLGQCKYYVKRTDTNNGGGQLTVTQTGAIVRSGECFKM